MRSVYKIGDRVRCIGTISVKPGSVGTVTKLGTIGAWVQFDDSGSRFKVNYVPDRRLRSVFDSAATVTAPYGESTELVTVEEAEKRLATQSHTITAQRQTIGALRSELATLGHKELEESKELEQLRTQLAGCSVAALGGTTSKETIAEKGDYGWSPEYQDVFDLRLKYDALTRKYKNLDHARYHEHIWLNDAATELGCDLDQVANVIRKIRAGVSFLDSLLYKQPEAPALFGGENKQPAQVTCGEAAQVTSEAPKEENSRKQEQAKPFTTQPPAYVDSVAGVAYDYDGPEGTKINGKWHQY